MFCNFFICLLFKGFSSCMFQVATKATSLQYFHRIGVRSLAFDFDIWSFHRPVQPVVMVQTTLVKCHHPLFKARLLCPQVDNTTVRLLHLEVYTVIKAPPENCDSHRQGLESK
jgi:hypothetical protein